MLIKNIQHRQKEIYAGMLSKKQFNVYFYKFTCMAYLKVFENYVLRVLSVFFLVLAIYYFFNQSILFGVIILLYSIFVIGGIGQSLKHNQKKNLSQLFNNMDDINEDSSIEIPISTYESKLIAKPLYFLINTLIILCVSIFRNTDFSWLLSIIFGILIGCFTPPILFLLGIVIERQIIKSRRDK